MNPVRWDVWSLPPAAVALLCAVVLSATAVVVAQVDGTPPRAQWLVLAACTLAPLLSLAVQMRVGEAQHRTTSMLVTQQDLWLVTAVVAVPSAWALVVAVPCGALGHVLRRRARRRRGGDEPPLRPHRTVFSEAVLVLCAAAAQQVFVALGGREAHPAGAGAAAAATFVAVNAVLLAAVLCLAAGGHTAGDFSSCLRRVLDPNVALAFVGVVIGTAALSSPAVLLLAAPLVLLAQRALLHQVLLQELQTDAKTGLASMPFWRDRAHRSLRLAAEGGPSVAVLMLDVDHFKQVNDVHGHLIGDQVLNETAGRVAGAVRPGDLVGRFGGEEFVVLLPSATVQEAHVVARRLVSVVHAEPVEVDDGVGVAISCSVGVAHTGTVGHDLSALLRAADGALYEAKRAGRDCVRPDSPAPAPRLPPGAAGVGTRPARPARSGG